MERNTLISYAIKYKGEYEYIINAIKDNEQVDKYYEVNAITILDKDYPKRFLDLKYPPIVLFYKGDISLLHKRCIGIVGSRIPCDYAIKATKLLSDSHKDKVIVSGLAKGIDYYAHDSAYKTIGILGCGIDYIYPYSNYPLYKKIEKNGLIISEYPFMSKPLAYHFPFRNRLISALSERIYIMQSRSRSGTMTTVNEALELGREIRVLPYDIFNENGTNNNQLIYEGATPIKIEELENKK